MSMNVSGVIWAPSGKVSTPPSAGATGFPSIETTTKPQLASVRARYR
jgi:hypothetical protein